MTRATLRTLLLCLALPLAAAAEESTPQPPSAPQLPFRSRGGVTFGFAPGSPNAYGIGAVLCLKKLSSVDASKSKRPQEVTTKVTKGMAQGTGEKTGMDSLGKTRRVCQGTERWENVEREHALLPRRRAAIAFDEGPRKGAFLAR